MGCFVALDFFLFYLFFEFMLLPMYFLIGIWGGPERRRAYLGNLLDDRIYSFESPVPGARPMHWEF